MLVPLVLLLAWRLYFRRQRTRLPDVAPAAARARSWIGADSELYAVEARLGGIGLGRFPHEPVSRWLARIETGAPPELAIEPIREIARLHYRYRFDPAGLSAAERERLRAERARVARAARRRGSPPIARRERAPFSRSTSRHPHCRRASTGAGSPGLGKISLRRDSA